MRRLPLLAAAVAALALSAPAQASKTQYTIFEAPRELASSDANLRAQTFDEIQALGARNIRVLLYWNSVAPAHNSRKAPAGWDQSNPDAGYHWSRYDNIVSEATARGMHVMLTVTGPVPKWATGHHKGHTYKPNVAAFGRFVAAVGRRYGGQVKTWSIWNEPNHPDFLTPQFVHGKAYSPIHYRALYKAALAGLRASGNGSDRVLAGETAPRGTPRVVSPLAFARGFFHGKGLKVSAWAHHPYTTKSGPFFKPPDRNDVTIGVLSRLTRQLDRLHRHIPLYLTEFGIQSKPDPYVGVSQLKQAEYRSIAERIAWLNPRVKAFSQYMMRDDAPRAGSSYVRYSGFESGLRTSDGRAKPAYNGFRLPLVARRHGSKVTLWGLARPATGATTVRVQYRNGKHWHDLRTVSTNRRGYFTTHTKRVRGRSYRILWGGYAGPRTRVY